MRRLTGSVFQSLDGVMQAPGGPSEDWTGGFTLGGWLPALSDDVSNAAVGALFDAPFDLLLGRKTYDIFAAYWPYVRPGHPIGTAFDKAAKHVLTRGHEPLDWVNSHRLGGVEEVATLKATEGPDLVIQGSSAIYPALLEHGLIDRLILMTFPVVLGSGKRLFGDGTPSGTWTMTDHKISSTGALIATYVPAGPVRLGSFLEIEPSAAEQRRQEQMRSEG